MPSVERETSRDRDVDQALNSQLTLAEVGRSHVPMYAVLELSIVLPAFSSLAFGLVMAPSFKAVGNAARVFDPKANVTSSGWTGGTVQTRIEHRLLCHSIPLLQVR